MVKIGAPVFLYYMIVKGGLNILELESLGLDKEILSSFEIGSVGINALPFQCGYLPLRVVCADATGLLHAELSILTNEARHDPGFATNGRFE